MVATRVSTCRAIESLRSRRSILKVAELGHADLKITLRYTDLTPDHLRGEMVKTEAQQQIVDAELASAITQGITHERTREVESLEDVSRTS